MEKLTFLPVVLCGGSGTRLWPLSRKSLPKQFVPLVDGHSLLELTLARLAPLSKEALCVGAEEHRFLLQAAMSKAAGQGKIILEPVARNTAPAMALAALHANADDLLLFCPADHYIPDGQAFARTVMSGVPAAQAGALVTFGVVPSFPSTAYGYIQTGTPRSDGALQVARFIEKPDAERAAQLLLAGHVLWNAGIFLARADTLLRELQAHAPDILSACQQAMKGAAEDNMDSKLAFLRPDGAVFAACRSESIDYAVAEHCQDVAVVPFEGAWSDVGSWNAVSELTPADKDGNRVEGAGLAWQARNTYIRAPQRPVVALGTDDLLIVDTPDAVLVAHKSRAEEVKKVVAELESRARPEAITHRKVDRPWGWYDSIDLGERFQVKRIAVKPGASLSLQKHYHRAEHWVVVKGTAEVTRGEETLLLTENQSTYIPIGVLHRLRNPGKTELEMIEVQSGSYLGEDDIVRVEDRYGRAGGEKK